MQKKAQIILEKLSDFRAARAMFKELANRGVSVEKSWRIPYTQGYYHPDLKKIRLPFAKGHDSSERLHTFFHEGGHALDYTRPNRPELAGGAADRIRVERLANAHAKMFIKKHAKKPIEALKRYDSHLESPLRSHVGAEMEHQVTHKLELEPIPDKVIGTAKEFHSKFPGTETSYAVNAMRHNMIMKTIAAKNPGLKQLLLKGKPDKQGLIDSVELQKMLDNSPRSIHYKKK